eukprot:6415779-Amphidinium_carterae.1
MSSLTSLRLLCNQETSKTWISFSSLGSAKCGEFKFEAFPLSFGMVCLEPPESSFRVQLLPQLEPNCHSVPGLVCMPRLEHSTPA